MKKKDITVQIFTGGYGENGVTYPQIEQKLKLILETGSLKRVIMGWSLQRELYEKTIKLVKTYEVECFLWIPVFSETGLQKPIARLIDDLGMEVKSYSLKTGENFEFYCPQNQRNIQSFLELYEENFSMLGFDGIFLDKIRYGGFSNGLSGVFNCFCPHCIRSYQEAGVDINQLKTEMKKVRAGTDGYARQPLNILNYQNGAYEFQNELWKHFFQKKRKDIEKVVTELTTYFHARGLLVGIDTFSPFMAYFTGQDVVKLGQTADFIKPMMYRITNAPAGLAFETDCLIRETAGDNEQTTAEFYTKLRCHRGGGEGFDIRFVQRELAYLTETGVPVYAGVEINRNEAAFATPSYIRENFRELETSGIDGFVLSWDLLSAPEENITEIIKYLRGR